MTGISRRDFIRGGVLASVALAAASLGVPLAQFLSSERVVTGKIGGSSSSLPLKIANASDVKTDSQVSFIMPLNPDGSRGQHPAILIRLRPELAQKAGVEFKAYSAVCPHLGCIVHLEPGDSIYCPCHAGYFDPIDGKVVAGPPKKPLPEVEIRIDELGDIYAEGWRK